MLLIKYHKLLLNPELKPQELTACGSIFLRFCASLKPLIRKTPGFGIKPFIPELGIFFAGNSLIN
jgi:hypothetical protein